MQRVIAWITHTCLFTFFPIGCCYASMGGALDVYGSCVCAWVIPWDKGLFTLDPIWMRIEFAFTRCALNASSIHIDCVHTAQSLKPNCYWHATPTAAQVTISALALSNQHSRCIETHTKVCTIICLTLSLVVDNVEREFRRTTQDHLISDLFFDSI